MSIKILIRSDEVVCYDKILDCYLKHKGNRRMMEMCKNRSIIRLMEKLRQRNDRRLIQNTLLLVLSLFDDHPPDLYSNLGEDVETLKDKQEKREVLSELRKEFIS